MLTARERIERQRAEPALIRLHRALSRLRSTVTMMNTGAHPDDEQSGMLAWFRLGMGMRVVVACSTRGEGGQNALGPERHGALGMVRTREMEEAARALDIDVTWLGHGPADPVHDFGFSKDGDATFDRWGEMRTVERLVRAYRTYRPDIVIPTFLDVPGQHGHHRAMTRAAETAIRLAADPNAFQEHAQEGLTPWAVAKYYLPAWSGGGDTYDDEVPPPSTTLMVRVDGREPATGAEYDRIGEWSRYYHASQGMGRWPETADTEWPLHLLLADGGSHVEADILDSLPKTLAALADDESLAYALSTALKAAQEALDAACSAFPHRDAIIAHLLRAAREVTVALAEAPADFLDRHGHRLTRKLREIDAALAEAAQVFDRASMTPSTLSPGDMGELTVDLGPGAREYRVTVEPMIPGAVASASTDMRFTIAVDADAPFSSPYPAGWSALGGNDNGFVRLDIAFDGHVARIDRDLEDWFAIVPASSLTLDPDALLLPLGGTERAWRFDAKVSGRKADLAFAAPDGIAVEGSGEAFSVKVDGALKPGLLTVQPLLAGRPAFRLDLIRYAHIGHIVRAEPEELKLLALDVKLPEGARIGYVGGGADRVCLWLKRMGLDVTELDAAALAGDLSRYTTIVVGIFAFGLRKDLAAATEKLHRFAENGGHLVTLYHRPTDGWNPKETPPRRLEIGTPSLRWRVTDPRAQVTVLLPDHPLLDGPNAIGAEDWTGWDKERGLYFAARWDDAYEPLLSMHDANEQPLLGALVSARIGKGRHTHTSLVLHHQLDRLVPGAFRLMANLVQPC